jgi:hypothetical protein
MTRLSQVRATQSGIFCILIGGLGAQLKRLVLRRTLHRIEQLDDHMLRDIGLSRRDIDTMRRHW